MKNKKWLKVLAALAMGGVMAVSTFGMIACGKGGNGGSGTGTEQGGGNEDGNGGGGGGGTTATVTSVTVTAAGGATSVTVGGATLQLTATVVGTNNPAQTVTWSASNGNATVSNTGVVTAVTAGTVIITATSTVDDTKKGDITLTVNPAGGGGGGVVDTETSQGYKDFVAAKGNDIVYKNDFETDAEVPFGESAATYEGGAKVYGFVNASATDYVEGGYVSISDGSLAIEDTESGHTVYGYVALENAVGGDKVVTVRLEYTYQTDASGWTHLFLEDATGSEIAGIRINSKKVFSYRVAAGSPYGSLPIDTDTTITAEFTLNYATGKLQVKAALGEDELTDITVAGQDTFNTAKDLAQLKFGTRGDSGSIYVGNLAISAEAAALSDVKDTYSAKVAAYHNQLKDIEYSAIATAVSGAKSTFDTAIVAATDKAAADAAYAAYHSTIVSVFKSDGLGYVQSADMYPAANYTRTENQSAYNAVIAELGEKMGAETVTTIDQVLAIWVEIQGKLDAINPDSYYAKADVTVTIQINGAGSYTVAGKKVGDKLTQAEIDAAIAGNLPAGHVVEGYYSNSDMNQAIDFGTDGYALNSEVANIYVKTELYTGFTYDFNAEDDGNKVYPSGSINGDATVAPVLDKDGNETGLYAVGTKATKEIKFDAQGAKLTAEDSKTTTIQVINFGGAADSGKSSLYFVAPISGTFTLTLKYFHGSSSNDRYMKVFTESGTIATTDVASNANGVTVVTDGKSSSDKLVKTATITFSTTAGTKIYFGSASSGIYLAYVALSVVS